MAAVFVLAATASSCGTGDAGVRAVQSGQGGAASGLFPTEHGNAPDGTTPASEPAYPLVDDVVDFGEKGPQHPEYDGFLTTAFGDLEQFWSETFPATYSKPWRPLAGGIYAAYPGRSAEIPGCGTPTSSYDDVKAGTAFYCIDGDFMAYDDADGLPGLVDLLGKEAVAIVLAHEFGHAIQARADEWEQPGVLKEQQADCFAGAWAAHVAAGESDTIGFDDAAVRAGLIAMIYVRDPIDGSGLTDPLAHGTGFDRVGAFQDGFEGGATRCKAFFSEDRRAGMIDIPFNPDDPVGNLPLVDPNPDPQKGPSDIVTLIPGSLDDFWTALAAANDVPFTAPAFEPFAGTGPYPTCEGIADDSWANSVRFCPADNTIHWDQDFATGLSLDELTGDMSVGYLFSNAYAQAIQSAINSQAAGEQRALFADCLTGSWVASIVPPIPEDRASQLTLSAGDLDEAIVAAIATSDERVDTDVNGSAFEKIGAFRTGVLGGLNTCNTTFS
jgi:predicted metalloprotease